MENNDLVKAFYENAYDEDDRENRESLEFIRSKSIIKRFLCESPMQIADLCGATGAYSFWLAEMGHQVHLLDLVPNHIEKAKDKAASSGISLVSYTCADARQLPYGDSCMNLVLLMGALYHLQEEKSRLECLKEAYRILAPGGRLICTVISRNVYLISALKYNLFDTAGITIDDIEDGLNSGISAKTTLPLPYCHTPDGIRSEMASAGFTDTYLFAVEGIANALYGAKTLPDDEKEAARLLRCIELTETMPDLIGVSRNIIAVGRKQ